MRRTKGERRSLIAKIRKLFGQHHIHVAAILDVSANTIARLRRVIGHETPKPRVKYYEWNGERKTVAEWAQQTGLAATLINKRVGKGWTIERALSQPRQKRTK